jgi:hypothetical protein
MLAKIVSEISNIWYFGYLKIQIQVLSNPFYLIIMLLTIKKIMIEGNKLEH